MGLLAKVQVLDSAERRAAYRRDVDGGSTVRVSGAFPHDVEVLDFSMTGARFSSPMAFDVGVPISIGLAGAGVSRAWVVRRDGNTYGCEFETPLSPARAALAFGLSSVVQFNAPGELQLGAHPVTTRWPGGVRFGLLLIGAVAAWAGAIFLFRAIF